MPIKNPRELFLKVLSHVRQGTERSAAIYKELGDAAQNPEIQEALAARAFVSQQDLEKLDEVFKMIGEKPVELAGRLHEVFVRISAERACGNSISRSQAAFRIGKG
jgi:ferritin-like metal-binding protein YciE